MAGTEEEQPKQQDVDLNQVFGTSDASYNQDEEGAATTTTTTPVIAPPNITAFVCSNDHVDVTTGDGSVTCTVQGFSQQSQIAFIAASFYNPDKTKRIPVLFTTVNLVSGSASQGIFMTNVTVPMGQDEAVWTLGFSDTAFEAMSIGDVLGNVHVYSASEAQSYLSNLQTTLKIESYTGPALAYAREQILTSTGVTVTGLLCDADGTAITLTPTQASANILCSIMVLLDGSGPGYVDTYFVSQTGKTAFNVQFVPDATTAYYQQGTKIYAQMNATITIPFWAEAGLYTMPLSGAFRAITVSRASTVHAVTSKELAVPPSFQLVTTAQDVTAPALNSFYCSPQGTIKIDNVNPTTIICNVRAAEDISGINYIGMQFVSPSKNQFMNFAYVPPSQGLGNFRATPLLNLKAQQSVSLPGGSEPGVWVLVRAVAADNAGNYRAYHASDFDANDVKSYFMVENSVVGFGFTPRDAGAVIVDPDHPNGQQMGGASTTTTSFLVLVLSSLLMVRLAWRQ